MRCYICNKEIEDKDLKFDPSTGTYKPCSECWEVIWDTLKTWEKDELDIPVAMEVDDLWGFESGREEKGTVDTDRSSE